MRQLRLKLWVGLAMVGALGSCGGGGQEPTPLGGPVINSGAVPQSFAVDAPISVQMTQWDPINVTITQGMTLTLTVDATGAPPLSYSWRRNNTVIPGVTEPRLVIQNIQASDWGAYTVTVANRDNIVISQKVQVKVEPHVDPTPPPAP